MFLKKIEIIGFKSFAQKTVLDFSSSGVFGDDSTLEMTTREEEKKVGITVIVGPNGSGKSNVADALRWALGEQSMKTIRGKKAGDIIFAGSADKSRLGSAQVSVFLDNKRKKIPVDFEEVVITRKVHQSGEGEYLINGSKVRLVDVIDLLAKAGIGQRSYTIVNQGMADRMLSASPLERRAIIEEAAGVKEFQVKKQRSENKFKSTKNNLAQVKSLLIEIKPHLCLLKRQYNKAQKGEAYRAELKEKQEKLFGFLWHNLIEQKEKIQNNKEELGRDVMKIQREADELSDNLKNESGQELNLGEKIAETEEKKRKIEFNRSNIERQILIEEGKLQLEEERKTSIEKVQLIPVDTKLIKDKLKEVKNNQHNLADRIGKIEKMSQLQEVKEYARAIATSVSDLCLTVERGTMEKKKPDKEIKKQKAISVALINGLEESIVSLKKQKEEFEKQLSRFKIQIEDLIKTDRQERKQSIEWEDQLRRKQFQLDTAKDKFNEHKIELARIEVKEEELENRIKSRMKIDPDTLKKTEEKISVGEFEDRIGRIRIQLEQIGAIDETVIEEYQETQKRYDFLTGESEDLKEAMKKLKKIVRQLDGEIKEKFKETFSRINKEFDHYFQIIFNGGKAKLKQIEVKTSARKRTDNDEDEAVLAKNSKDKTDTAKTSVIENDSSDEEETQIGVEIFATPAGKKISNLSMLSGGERTLTSIALLLAVISHNPPPFTLLDEVEAALDEANSKRFGRILRELSGQTQFILITHNRQTMCEASTLYGVTMGGDGISKLLSVKLDQVGAKGEIKNR